MTERGSRLRRSLAVSIALNVILGAAFIWTRPAAKLRARIDGAKEYRRLVEEFRAWPASDRPVVFVGDSLVAGAPFGELVSGILNRGIPGDGLDGLKSRIDEVTERQPRQVWLMIGTNDLKRGTSPQDVVLGIERIVERIQRQSPDSEILLQSILPTRPRDRGAARIEDVTEANRGLARVATKHGVAFVDLTEAFQDETGLLANPLTSDGVHLTPRGYEVWFETIGARIQSVRSEQ